MLKFDFHNLSYLFKWFNITNQIGWYLYVDNILIDQYTYAYLCNYFLTRFNEIVFIFDFLLFDMLLDLTSLIWFDMI